MQNIFSRTGHPTGLYVLFATEMWERFSFYGMRALLVLYLTKHVGMARADALEVYATYTALVYLTPLFGGYLSDHYLGQRRAIMLGGVLMALGHFAMAFEPLLYPAMGLLILGNGFFKPNISALVGELYDKNDPRRDSAYTIFYMGINLGAFFSPIVCGTLGEQLAWHWGFGAAGVGMLIALLTFLAGQKSLGDAGTDLHREAKQKNASPLTAEERRKVAVIFIVTAFSILFWTGFEQAGGTMTLFADEKTNRYLFGFHIPASWFQSINPLAILALAPVFAIGWGYLESTRFRLSSIQKQALGLILLAAGFAVMAVADQEAATGRVSALWLSGVYLLHTAGELCVSPVGLSLVNRLAPAKVVSMMMAVWFLSNFVANYMAGILEALLASTGLALNLWLFLTALAGVGGLALFAIAPRLDRAARS